MNFYPTNDVRVILPHAALAAIFDECDHFDEDETGGRVIGTFNGEDGKLTLQINGVIEAGPRARRTRFSFFQDGEHQECVFREIESRHPQIEHLGNWHTHHVNGLPTLSGGDLETYGRNVNHHKHNPPFFYALLVVAKLKSKKPHKRYRIKHYIFRRNDNRVYEIPQHMVEIVDMPLVWPVLQKHGSKDGDSSSLNKYGMRPERVYDRDVLGEFFEGIRPFTSEKLGFYWRGPLELVDGSKVQIILMEDSPSRGPSYKLLFRDLPEALIRVSEDLSTREFPSARAAIIVAERCCNRMLYRQRGRS